MDVLCKEPVSLRSLGERVAGTLFLPEGAQAHPAMVLCHGAGEFRENYFPLCEHLAERGVAALAIDMHGHGDSGGERFCVDMREWVADIQAALDFLTEHPRVDPARIAAFGLSSGGTAILEAALQDDRLRALVTLDATVRNSLGFLLTCLLKLFNGLGRMKRRLVGRDLRVPLAKMSGGFKLASDPEVDRRLQQDPRALQAFLSFPFPGASQAFFVDTLERVPAITAPTLVLWGEEDRLDPPETARLLFEALTCRKALYIIPGNGHVGHLDRNRGQVFALTAEWVLENLR